MLSEVWSGLSDGLKNGVRRSWNQLHEKLGYIAQSNRWRHVSGPIAAVCAAVLDLGLGPREVDLWLVGGRAPL
eukprot:4729003-Pyramimonas_sp.AAC.1